MLALACLMVRLSIKQMAELYKMVYTNWDQKRYESLKEVFKIDEKRNATKNIQCFSLIRLVKDVLYEGHDKPFFSFYDGDYFCGYDDNGNIKLSHEINNAQIISCNDYGNEVLNKIVDLITEHKLNYQHIFVQQNLMKI